jgi:hypothetical protein
VAGLTLACPNCGTGNHIAQADNLNAPVYCPSCGHAFTAGVVLRERPRTSPGGPVSARGLGPLADEGGPPPLPPGTGPRREPLERRSASRAGERGPNRDTERQLIATTPQGTLFQLSFCLLLYNMIQVIRGYVAVGQGYPVEVISTELLFVDVTKQLVALNELVAADRVVGLLPAAGSPSSCFRAKRLIFSRRS